MESWVQARLDSCKTMPTPAGNQAWCSWAASRRKPVQVSSEPKSLHSWIVAVSGEAVKTQKVASPLKVVNGKIQIPSSLLKLSLARGAFNLLAKILGPRPDLDTMFRWAKSCWAPTGQMDLIPLSHDFFLVKLRSEGDKNKILSEEGPWQYGNRLVFLRKWGPDFDPKTQNTNLKMVWRCLPDLPHHLWLDKVILSVGSYVRTFLSMDRASRTMAYARLCVLVDANATLPSFVEIASDLGILRQEI